MTRRIEHHLRAQHIGPHKFFGAHDAPIDMGFGGEVNDCVAVLRQGVHHGFRIADIADAPANSRVLFADVVQDYPDCPA